VSQPTVETSGSKKHRQHITGFTPPGDALYAARDAAIFRTLEDSHMAQTFDLQTAADRVVSPVGKAFSQWSVHFVLRDKE